MSTVFLKRWCDFKGETVKIDGRKEVVDMDGMLNLYLFLKSFSNYSYFPGSWTCAMLVFYRFVNNRVNSSEKLI